MANNHPSNVKNFRKPMHINLGTIIFGLVFVYILVSVILYFTRNRVAIYEVKAGDIVENQTYNGLALREEQIFYATDSGNLSLLAHEGTRVSVKTPVYSVTKDGSIADTMKQVQNNSEALGAEQYSVLYQDIVGFTTGYKPSAFQDVYTFKSGFNNSILELLYGSSFLQQENDSLDEWGIYRAESAGVVEYSVDGLESITYESFSPELLNKNNYSNEDLKGKTTVSAGDAVYKLVTNEPWEIIIRIDDSQQRKYQDDDYVQVRFLKDQELVWAQISKFQINEDWYCRLKFTNSMIRYANDRYLEIEVLLENAYGLKVPNSAIVEKEFFTVPLDYLVINSEEKTFGYYEQITDKNGNVSESYREISPYNVSDEENKAYLNQEDIKEGTVIVKKGQSDVYTVEEIGKLIGVYNVNKGYADFSLVTMLYQNDDYSIVKANEQYGLTQYDRIVLDGNSVNDEETIYQK